MGVFWALFRTIRPRQWLKNLSLYAALIFSGLLFAKGLFGQVTQAIAAFTLLTSAVYILNDLADVKADRLHPFKRQRPIASGALPVPLAVFIMLLLALTGLVWSYVLSYFFFLTCLVYIVLQVGYNAKLKQIPIVDVLVVASGYILRVYGGAFVIEAHMDVWFLLTVISVSLFLAIGKRRSELTLLKGSGSTEQIRSTLKRYNEQLLDIYTSMFATATWLTYSLFTFNHPRIVPVGKVLNLMASLPRTLLSEKLLMVTIPFVVYGVMRYLQLIYEKNEGESPERVLLSDEPLMATVVMWGILVVGILYYLG